MKATAFTRTGCTLGAKVVTYPALRRWYVCNECGCSIVTGFDDSESWAKCGTCGGRDFIRESQYEREVVEAWEVARGLPPELQALLGDREPMVDAKTAIAELFG